MTDSKTRITQYLVFSCKDVGITVSYWESLDAIKEWRNNSKHQIAIKKGKSDWYKSFKIRIAKVERDYEFEML